MKLSEIVSSYIERQPAGVVLGENEIERSLRKAVRFYCGFATLTNMPPAETAPGSGEYVAHSDFRITNDNASPQDVTLTLSEYAVIRPLFELYIEQENAMHLEASRGLGVDVFGRSSSEIAGDIAQMEMEIPHRAFFAAPETV